MKHALAYPPSAALAGAVARTYFDLASPRHALEHHGSRLELCVRTVLAYRAARCVLPEREFAYALLDIFERVYDEIRELEVIDLFMDAANVVSRIQRRLAAYLADLVQPPSPGGLLVVLVVARVLLERFGRVELE